MCDRGQKMAGSWERGVVPCAGSGTEQRLAGVGGGGGAADGGRGAAGRWAVAVARRTSVGGRGLGLRGREACGQQEQRRRRHQYARARHVADEWCPPRGCACAVYGRACSLMLLLLLHMAGCLQGACAHLLQMGPQLRARTAVRPDRSSTAPVGALGQHQALVSSSNQRSYPIHPVPTPQRRTW